MYTVNVYLIQSASKRLISHCILLLFELIILYCIKHHYASYKKFFHVTESNSYLAIKTWFWFRSHRLISLVVMTHWCLSLSSTIFKSTVIAPSRTCYILWTCKLLYMNIKHKWQKTQKKNTFRTKDVKKNQSVGRD